MLNRASILGPRILSHGVTLSPIIKARSLHSTAAARDFISWFRRRSEEKKRDKEKQIRTKDLIKDIETNPSNMDNDMNSNKNIDRLDLVPENFIGLHKEKIINMEEIPFNNWLSGSNKVTNESELDTIINKICKNLSISLDTTHPFPDLVVKFKFVKSLQKLTGSSISDYQLTILKTPLEFKEYYVRNILSGKFSQYNVKEPNAIYLTKKKFPEPNISIKDTISSRERKQVFSNLLQEIDQLEKEKIKENINKLRGS